jgi:hypothetical protein
VSAPLNYAGGTHQAEPSSLTDKERFCQLKSRNRGVLGDRRKIVQKLVKSLPAFQVVQ